MHKSSAAAGHASMSAAHADLARVDLPEGWQRMRFDVGDVLFVRPDSPPIAIPLPQSGRRAIHLGLVTRPQTHDTAMQVRVQPGGAWRRVRPMRFVQIPDYTIQDVELGVFDLSPGSVLQVRPEVGYHAAIASVRLADPGPAVPIHKNNAGVVFDTCMTLSSYRIEEPDDLLAVLRPYVDSDFTHIFWGTGVGTYSPLYFSPSLGWHGQEQKEFAFGHRALAGQAMQMFARRGIDPFQYAIDFAHDNGLQLWANYRISKNHEPDFRDDYPGGRFLLEHKDAMVLERSGAPHHQCVMSFTSEAIRAMAVTSLVEQAKYDIDGIYIDFLRKYPLAGWEKPSLDAFRKNTGMDPMTQPSSVWGVAWYRHLCTYVTQFLRELRVALQPIEQQRGRRIPIMAQVPGNWRFGDGIPSCMPDAMDPLTWAREGLIDFLAPAESTALMMDCQSFDRYSLMLAGTNCKLWGAIGPQFREGLRSRAETSRSNVEYADTDPWRTMAMAHSLYSQGAEGVYIWEAQDMPSVLQRWNVIRRLGDRQLLRETFGDMLGRFDGSHRIPATPIVPA